MNMNRDGRVFKLDVCRTFDDLYEMSNLDDDGSMFGLDVCKIFDDLYEKANVSDDGMFELDLSRRFDDLYKTANESDDIFGESTTILDFPVKLISSPSFLSHMFETDFTN